MAWIELHQTIWEHRKTVMLADELELDEIYAAAHMAKLWTWALDNTKDGYLSRLPNKVIAFGAGWRGDPDLFVRAAIKAGWFDETESGLYIHDWVDYAGKLMERRSAEKERSRKRREAQKNSQVDQQTTIGQPPVDQQTTIGTVPNRTIPNNDDDRARARPRFVETYEQEFGNLISPTDMQMLESFVKDGMDEEVVCEAIRRARTNNVLKMRYVTSILNDWFKKRVTDMAGVSRADLEFEQQKAKDGPKGQARAPTGLQALEEWASHE